MINTHKSHNVLGRYCWDCRIKVANGIPGWPMGHNGDFTRYSPWTKDAEGNGYTESIIWANGDSQTRREMYRTCSICDKFCANPVQEGVINNTDSYKEIRKRAV